MDGRDWMSELKTRATDEFFVRNAGATLGVAILCGLIAGLVNPTIEVHNASAVLTTLATAEASVLAIVFSVTVVALQLVVTRYSPRLTSLFSEDPLFRATFLLFVCAIAFNLLSTYLLPPESGRVVNATVGVAFALAGAAVVSLYRFILLMIHRSSPDELITTLVERELKPGKYLPATVEDLRETTVHPLRPLYTIVSRAIEMGEYRTAKQGIEAFQTVLDDTFAFLRANFEFETGHEFADAVTEEVLVEYYPPIVEQSFSYEQHGLVSDAVSVVERIAVNGLHLGFTDVTEHAADGLGNVFDDAPLTLDGNRLRRPVKEALVQLTKVTAGTAEYGPFASVFFTLNNQMEVLLRRRPEKDVTRFLVRDYYGLESVEIFEELIERFGPELNGKEIHWTSPTEDMKSTLPSAGRPLREFWRQREHFTQEVLRYRISEEEYPFVEGDIDAGWKKLIDKSAEAGLDGLAMLFCISTIKLAYRVRKLEEKRLGFWADNLARIRINHDPRIVDDAFAFVQSDADLEGGHLRTYTLTYEQVDSDQSFVERFLGDDESEEIEFDEWVEVFHEQVRERTESLSDS